MLLTMLKSKLHRAVVTEASLEYEGSLGVDADLLDAVKLLPYERILVSNLTNGNRFETYAIAAPAGSGTICLNGAAAHLGKVGDRIIVMSFAQIEKAEASAHHPLVLVLDEKNKPTGGLK